MKFISKDKFIENMKMHLWFTDEKLALEKVSNSMNNCDVEAIPIEYIVQRIRCKEQQAMRERNNNNYEAMDNLNHAIWELNCLLEDWIKDN